MDKVVELGAIEDGVVSKVVLEPAGLSLAGDKQESRQQPRQPVVTKVPQHPPGQKVKDNDVGKEGHKEPCLHFEHPLHASLQCHLMVFT